MLAPKLRSLFAANPTRRFVFWLNFFLHGAFLLGAGMIMSADSGTYSKWANELIRSGFNYPNYLRTVSFVIPPLFYLGWVTLVALCKTVFGSHWAQAIVLINLLADCGLAVMVVGLTKRVTHDYRAAWVALFLYVVTFDIFNWPRYMLTESTFLFLSFAVFAGLSQWLWSQDKITENIGPKTLGVFGPLAFGFLILTAIFWRPTGVVLLPLIGVAAVLWGRLRWHERREKQARKSARPKRMPKRIFIVAAVLLMVTGVLIAHARLLQKPERWPLKTLAASIQRNARDYSEGIVVHGRRDTYHAAPATTTDYVALSVDRFLHFFYPVHASFSVAHKALLLPFLSLTYLLVFIAFTALMTGQTQLKRSEEAAITLALCWVFLVALFHGMTQLDYDWRYRAPVLPHLVFLAAVGFSVAKKHQENRRAKITLP